ncbi:hypothetical protein [Streptomyces griseorubiginosus]|uniref:hypothetical protein n=1 Tax=Streptomyces griseorubiginosus TaxID=67304 RepID=UPI003455F506
MPWITCPPRSRPPPPSPRDAGGPTHALILLIAFLTLGTLLFREGTPIGDALALLGGCGAIGAGTLALVGGSRRLIAVLAEIAVRSGVGR